MPKICIGFMERMNESRYRITPNSLHSIVVSYQQARRDLKMAKVSNRAMVGASCVFYMVTFTNLHFNDRFAEA
jgi:hypothetical protein